MRGDHRPFSEVSASASWLPFHCCRASKLQLSLLQFSSMEHDVSCNSRSSTLKRHSCHDLHCCTVIAITDACERPYYRGHIEMCSLLQLDCYNPAYINQFLFVFCIKTGRQAKLMWSGCVHWIPADHDSMLLRVPEISAVVFPDLRRLTDSKRTMDFWQWLWNWIHLACGFLLKFIFTNLVGWGMQKYGLLWLFF